MTTQDKDQDVVEAIAARMLGYARTYNADVRKEADGAIQDLTAAGFTIIRRPNTQTEADEDAYYAALKGNSNDPSSD